MSTSAVDVLQAFCEACKLPFDRPLAQRAMAASMAAFPGDDMPTWGRRLMEVGECLELHVRVGALSLGEAWKLAREGVPVAIKLGNAASSPWLILHGVVRGRAIISDELGQRKLSRRALASLLVRHQVDSEAIWVCGQAALPSFASAQSVEPKGNRPLKPWARLLAFLRPETHDLWVILLFSSVVGVLGLATPIAVETLVNMVAFGQTLQPVVILSLLLFISLAFAAILRAVMVVTVEVLQRRIFVRVVEDLAYRLPRVPHTEWDHHVGPELVNRFFDVVTVQKASATLFIDGLALVLQALLGMIVLAFYHPYLLGYDVVLTLLMVLLTWVLGRGAVQTSIRESAAKYDVAHWLEQLSRMPTAFKYHQGPQLAADRADQFAVAYLERRRQHFQIVFRQICFALLLQGLAATTLLSLGGWLVIQGQLTLGQLVASHMIVTVIVGSFAKAGKHLEAFYDLMAAMEKLGHLFDLPIEPHARLFHFETEQPARVVLHGMAVHFGQHGKPDATHVGGTQPMDLVVEPGTSLALVGPAGCGKSRLLEVIAGLRPPTVGHVELDGIDYRELRPDSLREQIGFCREAEIFEGTILQNLDLHRPEVQSNHVREVLRIVQLQNDVHRLPDGVNTWLHASGLPFSRGQTAKLMLARAIVGFPRLLLIDGVLDELSEEEVDAILDQILAPRWPWTVIIATSRETVARRCQQQVFMGGIPSVVATDDFNDQLNSD